jgi:hypothetical protein
MSEKTKSAYVIRDFKDAGTEQSFTGGSTVDISEGAFINYKAAGLVTEANSPDAKAAKSDAKAQATPAA